MGGRQQTTVERLCDATPVLFDLFYAGKDAYKQKEVTVKKILARLVLLLALVFVTLSLSVTNSSVLYAAQSPSGGSGISQAAVVPKIDPAQIKSVHIPQSIACSTVAFPPSLYKSSVYGFASISCTGALKSIIVVVVITGPTHPPQHTKGHTCLNSSSCSAWVSTTYASGNWQTAAYVNGTFSAKSGVVKL